MNHKKHDGRPLISICVFASESIASLANIVEMLDAQTYSNIEILVVEADLPPLSVRAWIGRHEALERRQIRYVPNLGASGEVTCFDSVLEQARGQFFVIASKAVSWSAEFLDFCVDNIDDSGTIMPGIWRGGDALDLPNLGSSKSRHMDILSFLLKPTFAILLGVYRLSWIKQLLVEFGDEDRQELRILQSVFRGHYKTTSNCLCMVSDIDVFEFSAIPSWYARALSDLQSARKARPVYVLLFKMVKQIFARFSHPKIQEYNNAKKVDCRYSIDNISDFGRLSFSQAGEDLIIDFIFRALGVVNPTYLDVGAHHPLYFSNTHYFYIRGSRGVNAEADSTLLGNFELWRPHDMNLNIGVGLVDGESMPFYVMSVPTLNTFSKDEAELCASKGEHKIERIVDVPLLTMNSIVEQFFYGEAPDLISVDVEGMDLEIISSIDFQRFRPLIICVETITYSERLDGEKMPEIAAFLQRHDYFQYADTRVNSIFVDSIRWRI